MHENASQSIKLTYRRGLDQSQCDEDCIAFALPSFERAFLAHIRRVHAVGIVEVILLGRDFQNQ